ncbi:hypothetical protein Tco_0123655, partial [Tanacetum coccineum]
MEYCIEARALKSSLLSKQQNSYEEGGQLWSVVGINNVVNVSSDEFSVDDLLDLSDMSYEE